MKKTMEEKVRQLYSELWLSDELAERLATKLTTKDIQDLVREVLEMKATAIRIEAKHLVKLRAKDRMAAIEKLAQEEPNRE